MTVSWFMIWTTLLYKAYSMHSGLLWMWAPNILLLGKIVAMCLHGGSISTPELWWTATLAKKCIIGHSVIHHSSEHGTCSMGKHLLAKSYIVKLNELTESEVTELTSSKINETALALLKRQGGQGISIVGMQRKLIFNIYFFAIFSVSNGSWLPSCCACLKLDRSSGPDSIPTQRPKPQGLGHGWNQAVDSLGGLFNSRSNYVFRFTSYRTDIIYRSNMQREAIVQHLFSNLWSDEYLLSCYEVKLKIPPKWLVFHCDSMSINPIANRRTGDERGHQTAYFTHRWYCDAMRTETLNCGGKWRLFSSRFRVDILCNGSDWVPTWICNRTGNLNPLLSLAMLTELSDQTLQTGS